MYFKTDKNVLKKTFPLKIFLFICDISIYYFTVVTNPIALKYCIFKDSLIHLLFI